MDFIANYNWLEQMQRLFTGNAQVNTSRARRSFYSAREFFTARNVASSGAIRNQCREPGCQMQLQQVWLRESVVLSYTAAALATLRQIYKETKHNERMFISGCRPPLPMLFYPLHSLSIEP